MEEQTDNQTSYKKKKDEEVFLKGKLLTLKDITFHPIKFLEKLVKKDSIADTVNFYLKSLIYFGFGFFLPFYLFFSASYPAGKAIVISLAIICCNLIPLTIAFIIFFPIILHLLISLFREKSEFRNAFNVSVSTIGIFLFSITTIALGCWFIIQSAGMIIGLMPPSLRIVGNSLMIAVVLAGYCFLSVLMPVLIFISLRKFSKFNIFKSIVIVIVAFSLIGFSEIIFNKGGQLIISKFGENILDYVYIEDLPKNDLQGLTFPEIDTPSQAKVFYQQLNDKIKIPKELRESINAVIENGWQDNQQLRDLITANKQCLDLVKKATLYKSDGYIFTPRPEVIDLTMDIPSYYEQIDIIKLLLIEAAIHERDGEYSQAEESYLAAAGVLVHFSQEKVKILVSCLMEVILMDVGYPSFTRSLKSEKFSNDYYLNLQQKLELIQENQDFLKTSFEIESEVIKNTYKNLETEIEKQILSVKHGTVSSPEDIKKAILFSVTKNSFSADFFDEFLKTVEINSENTTLSCIAFAKNNTPELFRNQMDIIWEKNDKFYLRMLKSKKIFSFKTLAQEIANHLEFLSTPNHEKSINRHHIYYNRLNILITACAIKRYLIQNNNFPDQLNQLMPDYLNKIPEDTYNNFEPLSYENQADKVAVYSFGPDRDDDHAKTDFDQAEFFNNLSLNNGDISFSFSK